MRPFLALMEASLRANDWPIRVLVAAPHEAVRAAVCDAVSRSGFALAGECFDTADAIAVAARSRPDVCLLDLDLPDDPLAGAAAIAGQEGAPKVVILAGSIDEVPFFEALRAGVSGYLIKGLDVAALRAQVAAIARGGAALSPTLAARLIEEFRATTSSRDARS